MVVAKAREVRALIHHPTVGALGWALARAVVVASAQVAVVKAQAEKPAVLNLWWVYSGMMLFHSRSCHSAAFCSVLR